MTASYRPSSSLLDLPLVACDSTHGSRPNCSEAHFVKSMLCISAVLTSAGDVLGEEQPGRITQIPIYPHLLWSPRSSEGFQRARTLRNRATLTRAFRLVRREAVSKSTAVNRVGGYHSRIILVIAAIVLALCLQTMIQY